MGKCFFFIILFSFPSFAYDFDGRGGCEEGDGGGAVEKKRNRLMKMSRTCDVRTMENLCMMRDR